MRIVSLNINGMKAFYGRKVLDSFIIDYNPDIICLQETKCKTSDTGYWLCEYSDYHVYSSENIKRPGYAGVATMVKKSLNLNTIVSAPELSNINEYFGGRVLVTSFKDLTIVNVYTLNSGSGKEDLRPQWDEIFHAMISNLMKRNKNIVIVGDFNVCYSDLDHYNRSKYYDNYPSCYQFEIDGMKKLLDLGFTDAWRELNPDIRQYTWFSWRGNAWENNYGWRLDYPLVSNNLKSRVIDSVILDSRKMSDHFPIILDIEYPDDELYQHYKNGELYRILEKLKLQNQEGNWIDSYLYESLTGDRFARTVEEFEQKFKKIRLD